MIHVFISTFLPSKLDRPRGPGLVGRLKARKGSTATMFLTGRSVFELVLLSASLLGAGLAQAHGVVKDCAKIADRDERAQCLVDVGPRERSRVHPTFDHRTVEIPRIPEIMGK